MASGSTISIIVVLVVGFFIYRAGSEVDISHFDEKLASYPALRISLVIIIELFAFFFLRMYGYTMFETKRFQKEISKIYLKLISLEVAIFGDDKDKETVISGPIKTERNIIIKKGDVSLSQLRDIAEREGDAVVLNFIKALPDSLTGAASKLFIGAPLSS